MAYRELDPGRIVDDDERKRAEAKLQALARRGRTERARRAEEARDEQARSAARDDAAAYAEGTQRSVAAASGWGAFASGGIFAVAAVLIVGTILVGDALLPASWRWLVRTDGNDDDGGFPTFPLLWAPIAWLAIKYLIRRGLRRELAWSRRRRYALDGYAALLRAPSWSRRLRLEFVDAAPDPALVLDLLSGDGAEWIAVPPHAPGVVVAERRTELVHPWERTDVRPFVIWLHEQGVPRLDVLHARFPLRAVSFA